MMKATQVSRISHQIRVIRVSRPAVHPIERKESVDSRIPSSVESWLSSVPSIKESEVQHTPKRIIRKPSTIENVQQKNLFSRRFTTISIIVLVALIMSIIVGLVLAITLQPTKPMTELSSHS